MDEPLPNELFHGRSQGAHPGEHHALRLQERAVRQPHVRQVKRLSLRRGEQGKQETQDHG